MKLSIMQPYFFPYLGYYTLIDLSDKFILFDTPQFIRHGWIERNRIIKANGDPLYIKVSLEKRHRETPINQIKIRKEAWKEKILAQLIVYKKKAPNYRIVLDLIQQCWDIETDSIVNLNKNILETTCKYLDIETPIDVWSEMNLRIGQVNEADEWALEICKSLNASTYYNPIGGLNFFNIEKYKKNKIDIHFINSIPIEYKQLGNNFVPNLSIIDVMMFNSKDEIKKMLNQYELI